MIDELDSKIIRFLQKDGRMAYSQIARELNISEPTVRGRVQRLIQDGVIQIIAMGDPIKLGFNLAGNLKVQVDYKKLDSVLEELERIDEIWYIAIMTGANDLDIEFIAKSMEDLRALIFRVNNIDGIVRTESSLIMSMEKERYDWGTAIG